MPNVGPPNFDPQSNDLCCIRRAVSSFFPPSLPTLKIFSQTTCLGLGSCGLEIVSSFLTSLGPKHFFFSPRMAAAAKPTMLCSSPVCPSCRASLRYTRIPYADALLILGNSLESLGMFHPPLLLLHQLSPLKCRLTESKVLDFFLKKTVINRMKEKKQHRSFKVASADKFYRTTE